MKNRYLGYAGAALSALSLAAITVAPSFSAQQQQITANQGLRVDAPLKVEISADNGATWSSSATIGQDITDALDAGQTISDHFLEKNPGDQTVTVDNPIVGQGPIFDGTSNGATVTPAADYSAVTLAPGAETELDYTLTTPSTFDLAKYGETSGNQVVLTATAEDTGNAPGAPVSVDSDAAFASALEAGGNIVLDSNVVVNSSLHPSTAAQVDLNGHTLTVNGGEIFPAADGSDVTYSNSKATADASGASIATYSDLNTAFQAPGAYGLSSSVDSDGYTASLSTPGEVDLTLGTHTLGNVALEASSGMQYLVID